MTLMPPGLADVWDQLAAAVDEQHAAAELEAQTPPEPDSTERSQP